MGIESDQIVFDYLSKVGDLAQSRQLPSSTRMRLVADLRTEIDRRRAANGAESPAAVRRLIGRLGSPDEIVAGAKAGDGTYDFGSADDEPDQGRGTLGRIVPKARAPRAPRVRRKSVPDEPPVDVDEGPAPPHLAGTDELGTIETADWWRAGGGIPGTEVDDVPGFVGGIEIPDILKPPGPDRGPDLRKRPAPEPAEAEEEYEEDDDEDDAGKGARASRVRRLVRPRGAVVPRASFGRSFNQPFLLLAALVLVAGAVLGNILVLLIGWAVIYLSRQLTVVQKKVAVFGLPGLAVVSGIVWLWGRGDGRWGDPIPGGRLSGALDETWPWVLRCAAIASALYLVWRARSPRP